MELFIENAARAVFGAEPLEVRAQAVGGRDTRSREVDETTAAVLRFPGDRLATLVSSFGAASTSWFEVVGTGGRLRLDAAFDESGEMELTLVQGGRTQRRTGRIGDQFAAEIDYFADCVRTGRDPEPGAEEGLRDMRVIDAIIRAAERRSAVVLPPLAAGPGPQRTMIRRKRPSQAKPTLVHAPSPALVQAG